MRFSLFAHMIQVEETPKYPALYEDFMQLCELADNSGMHAIWTGEHHCMNFTISPNPFIIIADLARRTRNVRLGTGTIVAPFWHPLKLANEAAMTDIICNGRLDIGIARGAYSFEYERMLPGLDAWAAGQRMREMIPLLQQLWQGDVCHQGEFYNFPTTTAVPKPVQQPGPPLWVAARDPSSHDFAVANGCQVQVTPLWQGEAEIESLMEKFNHACAENTTVPRPQIMLLHHAYVGKDEQECEWAAKQLSRFYCYFGAWFKNERPINNGCIAPLTAEEQAAISMFSPAQMRANMAIGTSKQVIERLKHYEGLGYDEYAYWLDTGMSGKQNHIALQRFIDEVIPAFN